MLTIVTNQYKFKITILKPVAALVLILLATGHYKSKITVACQPCPRGLISRWW